MPKVRDVSAIVESVKARIKPRDGGRHEPQADLAPSGRGRRQPTGSKRVASSPATL
jgi:hypothetical protein